MSIPIAGVESSGPAKGQATAESHERVHAVARWRLSDGPAMAQWVGEQGAAPSVSHWVNSPVVSKESESAESMYLQKDQTRQHNRAIQCLLAPSLRLLLSL